MIPRTPAFDAPPGSAGAPSPKPQTDGAREQQRRAWEREMERAQMAAWLGLGPLQAGAATAPLLPPGPAPVRVAPAGVVERASVQPQPRDAQLQEAAPMHPADAVQLPGNVSGIDADVIAGAFTLVQTEPSIAVREDAIDTAALPLDAPRDTQPAIAQSPDAAAPSTPHAPVAATDDATPPQANTSAAAAAPPPHDNDAVQPGADTVPRSIAVETAREQTRQLAAQIESFGTVAATTIMAMQRPDHRAPAQGQGAMPTAAQTVGAPAVGRIPANVLAAHPNISVGNERSLPPALQQRIAAAARPNPSTPEAAAAPAAPAAPQGAARLDRPNPARSPAAPIRLHAQWTAEGVHLWLALDAGMLAQMGPIVEQLRQWLKLQGVPLLSLVCNGQPVDLDAVPRVEADKEAADVSNIFPQENTVWPSVP
ncbi:MAG: hypothetical protein V4864_11040 [Pseudomonadota bacterium]